jgi:uncharacterized protein involved in outer membrane biogenesis
MKKWILRIVLASGVVAAIAVFAVFYFLNDIVKGGVETVGPQLTKGEMRLAKAKLSPFSGQAQLTGLFVGNPQGWKTESAIKVGDVKVALDVRSALSDVVMIESILIEGPEITYEGGLGGSNIGKILENIEAFAGGGGEKPAAESSSASSKKFKVKDIQIRGAKVHLSTAGLGGKALTVPLADMRLQNIGTDGSGVTAAQLSRDILKPLLASITKAAAEAATNVGGQLKDVTKGTTDQLNKTTEGIKSLLKK